MKHCLRVLAIDMTTNTMTLEGVPDIKSGDIISFNEETMTVLVMPGTDAVTKTDG